MRSNETAKPRGAVVKAAARAGNKSKAKGDKVNGKDPAERVEIYVVYFRVERGVTTLLCSSTLKYHDYTVHHHHLRRGPREAVDYLLESYEFDSPTTIYVQTKKLFQHISQQARGIPTLRVELMPAELIREYAFGILDKIHDAKKRFNLIPA